MDRPLRHLRAAVQSRVGRLEVLRAAPRLDDQNANPRLNSLLSACESARRSVSTFCNRLVANTASSLTLIITAHAPPSVSYYAAPTVSYYSPVSYYAPAASYYATPTASYYAPAYYAPVTTYYR